jgi:tRNA nucleotidyltransferase/poly(A) polymerase
VRDMLLNRLSEDLDFAVPSNGIALARRVANALQADFVILDDERDTGRVIVTQEDGTRTFIDLATYRGSTLEDDLRDRDFTMNAIAFDIRTQTLIDPLNGATDLRSVPVPLRPSIMIPFASYALCVRPRPSDSRSTSKPASL